MTTGCDSQVLQIFSFIFVVRISLSLYIITGKLIDKHGMPSQEETVA